MFKSGHNQCKKKQTGTYKLDLESFIRAYTRQVKEEYEAKGADYDVDEDAMAYLECQQYYYNNNLVSDTKWNGMEQNEISYRMRMMYVLLFIVFSNSFVDLFSNQFDTYDIITTYIYYIIII